MNIFSLVPVYWLLEELCIAVSQLKMLIKEDFCLLVFKNLKKMKKNKTMTMNTNLAYCMSKNCYLDTNNPISTNSISYIFKT